MGLLGVRSVPSLFRLSYSWCILMQKAGSIINHFVHLTLVFMHIPRAFFIFNIFWGQRPFSGTDEQP